MVCIKWQTYPALTEEVHLFFEIIQNFWGITQCPYALYICQQKFPSTCEWCLMNIKETHLPLPAPTLL